MASGDSPIASLILLGVVATPRKGKGVEEVGLCLVPVSLHGVAGWSGWSKSEGYDARTAEWLSSKKVPLRLSRLLVLFSTTREL